MKHGFVELVVFFCTTTNLIKKLNQFIEDFSLFIKQYCVIVWSVKENSESKNRKVARPKKTEG